jgi:polysaccharide biosynthesis PFTS motif protein
MTGISYQIALINAQSSISYRFNSKMVKRLVLSAAKSKKVRLPIPRILWDNFREVNFKISKFSAVENFLFEALLILRSVLLMFKSTFGKDSINIQRVIAKKKSEGYSVVILNPKFPKGAIYSDKSEFNFITWHSKKIQGKVCYLHFNKNLNSDEKFLKNENIIVIYVNRMIFNVPFKDKFKLYGNLIRTIFNYSRIVPGKFISILKIIDQIVLYEKIQIIQKQSLPNFIIFSDSDGILKPFWVNALENRKIRIQYFFFSSYDSPSVILGEDPRTDFWKLNSWPEIHCVDSYQANFIETNRLTNYQQIYVSGFPDFTDYPFDMIQNEEDSRLRLLVFDYEPRIGHYGYSSINDCGYYSYESNIKFIRDLYELAKELNLIMFHKPKRIYADSDRDVIYTKFIKSLDTNLYKKIDPRVSPRKLIKQAHLVISKPITSTAFIAKTEKINSIFFDPIGKINPSDPALRSIPLFRSTKEIKDFLDNQITR